MDPLMQYDPAGHGIGDCEAIGQYDPAGHGVGEVALAGQ